MNILVTINKNYLFKMFTMINSLSCNNKGLHDVFVVSNDVTIDDLSKYKNDNIVFHLISYFDEKLEQAPTSKRYPSVIYYRLLAAKYLPSDVDKILYLDPDIIVLKDLSSFYNQSMKDIYYIGASNVKKTLRKFNEVKNSAPKDSPYINTGVILINVKELRNKDQSQEIYDYILKKRMVLTLPDQDILQGLYGDKVKLVDHYLYNLSDRAINAYNRTHIKSKIDESWVEKNCYIIHFLGRNKPWKENYVGILKQYYLNYEIKEK